MITQEGGNVAVVAVRGNFDDTQTGVKSIFNDKDFNTDLNERGFKFSSANSINWGRLLPQIVYYFSAYADMVKSGRIAPGQKVNFVVPTGNFGNILAGYYAKLMGLPVNRLICAANSNNVLTEFLRTGVYNRIRDFHKTLSPSMDILISSNLERLLYHITGGDTAKVSGWMRELTDKGCYKIGEEGLQTIQETFWSDWVGDNETLFATEDVYRRYRYVADPHTAVAWRVYENYRRETGDETSTVVISTASPFKFNDSVLAAIAGKGALSGKDGFAILRELSRITGWPVPTALAGLEHIEPRHHRVCDKEEMPDLVENLLE
jgi:threonine synthase